MIFSSLNLTINIYCLSSLLHSLNNSNPLEFELLSDIPNASAFLVLGLSCKVFLCFKHRLSFNTDCNQDFFIWARNHTFLAIQPLPQVVIFLRYSFVARLSMFIYAFFDLLFADAIRFIVCFTRIFEPRGILNLTTFSFINHSIYTVI